jgi:hypothetical protein
MTQTERGPRWPRGLVRLAVATALAVLAALVAREGGAPWSAALLLAAGAASFVAWRTKPGARAGFALMLGAALAGAGPGPHGFAGLRPVIPALASLEALGPATIAAVALVRRPRRVSRRLLGAWLASSGLVMSGLAMCTRSGAAAAGSALLAGGLAYRLGAVPAYAWAPMLLRHPSRIISATGTLALAGAGSALALTMAVVPDSAAAWATLAALAVATLPWAAWQAARQRRRDPPCARTYGLVALTATLVLASGAVWWLRR